MRRLGTWFALAAVCGVALAAVVDALRAGDEHAGAPTGEEAETRGRPVSTQLSGARAAADELRAEGISGRLLWIDESCRVHELELPDVSETVRGFAPACRISVSPGGTTSFGVELPDPERNYVAFCRGRFVELVGRRSTTLVRERFRGCAPAWRPDGRLTFVRDGHVAGFSYCERLRPCIRLLVSRRDLVRAVSRDPWAFPRPAFQEIAWLTPETFAAVVTDEQLGEDLIALFRGRRFLGAPPFPYRDLSDLRISPFGRYVAARVEERGLVVLDNAGRYEAVGFRTARAITWSPDETWTAVATSDGVYIFATGERPVRLIRLPLDAVDLFWR